MTSIEARPVGVTLAAGYGIVSGALLVVAAYMLFFMSPVNPKDVGLGPALLQVLPLVVIPLTLGLVGGWAGLEALSGAAWARWALVGSLVAGVLTSPILLRTPFMPLALLDIVAIALLVRPDAKAWFAAQALPSAR